LTICIFFAKTTNFTKNSVLKTREVVGAPVQGLGITNKAINLKVKPIYDRKER
jgi:hypothetical protein